MKSKRIWTTSTKLVASLLCHRDLSSQPRVFGELRDAARLVDLAFQFTALALQLFQLQFFGLSPSTNPSTSAAVLNSSA